MTNFNLKYWLKKVKWTKKKKVKVKKLKKINKNGERKWRYCISIPSSCPLLLRHPPPQVKSTTNDRRTMLNNDQISSIRQWMLNDGYYVCVKNWWNEMTNRNRLGEKKKKGFWVVILDFKSVYRYCLFAENWNLIAENIVAK